MRNACNSDALRAIQYVLKNICRGPTIGVGLYNSTAREAQPGVSGLWCRGSKTKVITKRSVAIKGVMIEYYYNAIIDRNLGSVRHVMGRELSLPLQ